MFLWIKLSLGNILKAVFLLFSGRNGFFVFNAYLLENAQKYPFVR